MEAEEADVDAKQNCFVEFVAAADDRQRFVLHKTIHK